MQSPTAHLNPYSKLIWRPLCPTDIPALLSIASTIHPTLPERPQVFAERISLFPAGCLALSDPKTDALYGYLISHPIRFHQPPRLDTLLGHLPSDADQYYIHDVAIMPAWRGKGYARTGVEEIMRVADEYASTCLVSVYDTAGFWEKYGFQRIEEDEEMSAKMREYGDDAVFLERGNWANGDQVRKAPSD